MMRACVVTTQRVCFDSDNCWACVERIMLDPRCHGTCSHPAKYPMGTIELARTQQDYRHATPHSLDRLQVVVIRLSVCQSSKGSTACI